MTPRPNDIIQTTLMVLGALVTAHEGGHRGVAVARFGDAFVAPEVRSGAAISEAADVYSAGAFLYYVATGASPHTARRRAAAFGALPAPFARIVLRALHPDPAQRWRRAKDMLCALLVARERVCPR